MRNSRFYGTAALELGSRREGQSESTAGVARAGDSPLVRVPQSVSRSPAWTLEEVTSVQALRESTFSPILDLRSPSEYCACHLRHSIPLSAQLTERGRWLERLVGRPSSVLLVADTRSEIETCLAELTIVGVERFLRLPADPYRWLNGGLAPAGLTLLPEGYLDPWLRADRPILDVRDPWSREEGRWRTEPWIPLDQLPDRLTELPAAGAAILAGDPASAALAAAVLERAGSGAEFVVEREPEVWVGQALFKSWDSHSQALAVALAA